MKPKVISTHDFSSIKKMAQIVNPLVSKKNNILKKIAALKEEIEGPEGLNVQIAGMEAGIKARFLGLGTEQLVRKVVTPAVREDGTPVLDAKTGKQLTKTTLEPLACLVYNAEKNNYTLTIEEEEYGYSPIPQAKIKDVEAVPEEDQSSNEAEENPFGF